MSDDHDHLRDDPSLPGGPEYDGLGMDAPTPAWNRGDETPRRAPESISRGITYPPAGAVVGEDDARAFIGAHSAPGDEWVQPVAVDRDPDVAMALGDTLAAAPLDVLTAVLDVLRDHAPMLVSALSTELVHERALKLAAENQVDRLSRQNAHHVVKLNALRELHRIVGAGDSTCRACGDLYPCATRALLDPAPTLTGGRRMPGTGPFDSDALNDADHALGREARDL